MSEKREEGIGQDKMFSGHTHEREMHAANGWGMLLAVLAMLVGGAFLISRLMPAAMLAGIAVIVLALIFLAGFFVLQPNEARVMILFGAYKGTVKTGGFLWANPFYSRGSVIGTLGGADFSRLTTKISLRLRNFVSERLKVNDKRGNPIEIAAVVVWRVEDTAQAMFDVDNYAKYVQVQTESAIRQVASSYAYDHGEEHEVTLRSNTEEVAHALRVQLQERLIKAGVAVEEARLTHLAYAPEVASAMLRRQQAEAVLAARKIIVQGAVSMVDMALRELAAKQVLQMDDERKAAMVSNLMVVLCGEAEVHPVVNTGTLYT